MSDTVIDRDDVKSCPFCGTKGKIFVWDEWYNKKEWYIAGCDNKKCYCYYKNMAIYYTTIETAVEKWNKRL